MTSDKFGEYVASIFKRRSRLSEESRALTAQRDVLLPKLVSGQEVRVGESNVLWRQQNERTMPNTGDPA